MMPSRRSVAYAVQHENRYEYRSAVATSQHIACLRPRELPHQRVLSYNLRVKPAAETFPRVDHFGNTAEHFTVLGSHRELLVISRSLVVVEAAAVTESAGPASSWEEARDALVYRKGGAGRAEAEFVFPSPCVEVGPLSRDYAAPSFEAGRPLAEAAAHLMHRIHEDFTFDAEATTVATPVGRVLDARRGVCQDLAHVMISCFRSLGLPARYVSGYLLTDPPPGEARLLGADASHAWVSLHCPGLGWLDLDPTNDVVPDLRHVVVAWGRDYGDVCPLRGVFVGDAGHRLDIGVSMVPLGGAALERALGQAISQRRFDLRP